MSHAVVNPISRIATFLMWCCLRIELKNCAHVHNVVDGVGDFGCSPWVSALFLVTRNKELGYSKPVVHLFLYRVSEKYPVGRDCNAVYVTVAFLLWQVVSSTALRIRSSYFGYEETFYYASETQDWGRCPLQSSVSHLLTVCLKSVS